MADRNAGDTANDSTSKAWTKKMMECRSVRKAEYRKWIVRAMKKLVERRAAGSVGWVEEPAAATSSGPKKKKKKKTRSIRKAKFRKVLALEKLVACCAARRIGGMEESAALAEGAARSSGWMNCRVSNLGKKFIAKVSERTAQGWTGRIGEERAAAPAASKRCGKINRLQKDLVTKFFAKGAAQRRKAQRAEKMHGPFE